MKTKGKLVCLLSLLFILLLVFNTQAFGQEERKIKMDEYRAQLTETQQREADANAKLQQLDADIAELKSQLDDVQSQIDATWDEIYAMLGTNKAGVDDFRGSLEAIDSEIDGLAALSPEELFRHREELEDIEKRIEEKKGSQIALLTEMENKIAEMESKIAGLKAKMPANIYDQYTVIKGDYLWKISKNDEIYGDPYQWIRIYCVNKDQIKDPDLIYPEQVFNIARGVAKDEHLVVKGEYLSSIAGLAKVFNDPTKWTQIYEANKDVVTDPNLVYPHQVLKIPAE